MTVSHRPLRSVTGARIMIRSGPAGAETPDRAWGRTPTSETRSRTLMSAYKTGRPARGLPAVFKACPDPAR